MLFLEMLFLMQKIVLKLVLKKLKLLNNKSKDKIVKLKLKIRIKNNFHKLNQYKKKKLKLNHN